MARDKSGVRKPAEINPDIEDRPIAGDAVGAGRSGLDSFAAAEAIPLEPTP